MVYARNNWNLPSRISARNTFCSNGEKIKKKKIEWGHHSLLEKAQIDTALFPSYERVIIQKIRTSNLSPKSNTFIRHKI